MDYITFKFQDLDNLHQTKIANYLFKLGFNSYKESGKLAKPIKEPSFEFNFKIIFISILYKKIKKLKWILIKIEFPSHSYIPVFGLFLN